MTRPLLVAAALVVTGLGFAGATQQGQPILGRLPPAPPADPNNPPPNEPCPDPPCHDLTFSRTPTGFLTWVGRDLATFWRRNMSAVPAARWRPPRQVIVAPGRRYRSSCFDDRVTSRSGMVYCATDRPPTVFLPLDTVRSRVLRQRNWARWRTRGFAIAYVAAHEWAHHVQSLFGLLREPEVRGVRIELQADCIAGFWAHSQWTRGLLDENDIREAVALARLNGDAPGSARNHRGRHGTPDERERWFKRGYVNGDAAGCVVD
jgi:predicted metalloprotease